MVFFVHNTVDKKIPYYMRYTPLIYKKKYQHYGASAGGRIPGEPSRIIRPGTLPFKIYLKEKFDSEGFRILIFRPESDLSKA